MSDVVLDTCVISALARHAIGRARAKGARHHAIDLAAANRSHRIVVDRDRAIESEWCKTCGEEVVRAMIVRWVDCGAFKVLSHQPTISAPLKRALLQVQFIDTVDKVIVAVAMATTDRIIVTEDSDFWDPRDRAKKNDAGAYVARLLASEHVRLYTLKSYVAELERK